MGFRYSAFKDDSYKETGAGIYDLSVSSKKSYNSEIITGLKAKKDYFSEGGTKFSPEIGVTGYFSVKNKPNSAKISASILNSPVEIKAPGASKAWYGIGVNLSISKNGLDSSISYEAQIDKKYIGHGVALKFRYNF